ncbi:DNA repair protein RecO [Candidatus Roizmanbacteria bacterium CG_4_8_14_3_um_filter_34_9]|uniref:DNA repair protein RecO n=3 Tax=Candidatus Roizmaniibacteriota TaxID=1752723 RepID=A0A2M7AV58_9BACT|nr:MAG: DNA repair protein RecO [Candidatus Roizmanbacteria bacterium CG07_land_8_20_14_0_80_34_15]PIU74524.1 MAG: DNA repair protein RecO [Candidatus Roizmanbacteria bacterium CG06_land_8_20_14_3_00_34_14]PIW73626.1 MAG: DNA repair protein RecO [Candidatus Roizmanbacteria bacterium CG_4_8_14_3_um_filter_34_9]
MSRSLKTEAIILKKKDLLNKDVLISVFSQDLGRLTLFAKGIKKITSRRSPHLQTGNLVNILVSHKNERYYLQESELLSGFSELKKDEKKVSNLYLFLFVLECLLPEQQKETKAYNLTKNFLIDLSKSTKPNSIAVKYLSDIMMQLGYLDKKVNFPELKSLIEEIINEKIPLLQL